MLFDICQSHFFIVVNLLFLLVFLLIYRTFDKESTHWLASSLILLIVLTVTESVDFSLSLKETPSMLHTVTTILTNLLQPLILYVLCLVIIKKKYNERVFMAIPVILNALGQFSALFCGLIFTYNEANQLVYGPLGYISQVCSAVYVGIILVVSAKLFKSRNYKEAGWILLTIVAFCGIAAVLEFGWQYEGLIHRVGSFSAIFFFLYYCIKSIKLGS